MTNQSIRSRALSILKNRWFLPTAAVLVVLLSQQLLTRCIGYLNIDSRIDLTLRAACLFLLFPLMSCGLANIFMALWHGRSARFSMLFHFFTSPRRYFGSLAAGLAYVLFDVFTMVCGELLIYFNTWLPFAESRVTPLFTLLLLFILLVSFMILALLSLWLMLRLALIPYICVVRDGRYPFNTIRESFRRMKKRSASLFCMWLATGWPAYAGTIIITLILGVMIAPMTMAYNYNEADLIPVIIDIFFTFIISLVSAPLLTYFYLSEAGFADRTLLMTNGTPPPPQSPREPLSETPNDGGNNIHG